ncbi:MAG: phage baseplate assembly protein V [Roseiflexaceae bacterium]|nr:phage baseplate assembly protein V [Roseiflexaceae bacterium]
MPAFYGKYRGTVTQNNDPMRQGRLMVTAPEVLGGLSAWAMPCVPYAGMQVGLFLMPPVGAHVWIEFESGNPDFPIWSGCFWGPGELPAQIIDAKAHLLKIDGVSIMLSDGEPNKGLSLEIGPPIAPQPITLKLDPKGITLSIGQVSFKLTAQDIQLAGGPTTIKLQMNGIEMSSQPATFKLAASGIEATSGPASVKVAPASVELSNGASSVKLSPATVNINNGALEVI